ncbi:nitroreductase family protein [Propionibacterium freudenreichii]|uniref:nitroreductase family protein n=1 Tax=Propionibacterium freudenreichii TaxID=1744 RepID=UPI0021A345B5|nr:nitroreductase family protein [Propionibacterium freudenreichii]MCT3002502.1 hypothetical protein [Propionibacterium freudenreichii]
MADITPLLADRWSPHAFDKTHVISEDQVQLLLEAARWAPSAMNRQPWSFVVGVRDDDVFARLRPAIEGFSDWALDASAIILGAYQNAGSEPDYALYDLGQSMAHLTVQAEALGLHVRQFATFDRPMAGRAFNIAAPWEPIIMAAVGLPAPGQKPEGRARKPAWAPNRPGQRLPLRTRGCHNGRPGSRPAPIEDARHRGWSACWEKSAYEWWDCCWFPRISPGGHVPTGGRTFPIGHEPQDVRCVVSRPHDQ